VDCIISVWRFISTMLLNLSVSFIRGKRVWLIH